MTKYYGIGKEGCYKYHFSIFLGNKMIEIALYTKVHKFKPQFYYYRNCAWDEQTILKIKWLVGLNLNVA